MLKNKFPLAFLSVFFFSSALMAQSAIESLRTDSMVMTFVRGLDSLYSDFELVTMEYVYDPEFRETGLPDSVKAWTLFDLDRNGRTDLLAWEGYIRDRVIVVLDLGRNRYKTMDFYSDPGLSYCFPLVRDNRLWLYPCDTASGKPVELGYRFGGLIEIAAQPVTQHKIRSIDLNTDYCMGACHVFRIDLFDSRRVVYTAWSDAPLPGGTYETYVSKAQWKEICGLLNYMDFSRMPEYYAVNWTCDQTYELNILYESGHKRISDYGYQGTLGLMLLYEKLDNIITTARWKKLD